MPPKRTKRALEDAGNGGTNASTSKKSSKTTRNSNPGGKENTESSTSSKEEGKGKDKVPTQEEKEDPYEYVTLCRPRHDILAEKRAGSDDEEEDGDDDEDDEEDENRCGGGGCMCNKKAADYPDWKWIAMRDGFKKISDYKFYANYRDPDNFDMYTFNDHLAYGIAEMIENLLIDFNKAKTPRAQWIVMEALSHFLTSDDAGPINGLEDGQRVCDTLNAVGTAFLAALNNLDREGLLKPDSEIKDLALVMGLFLDLTDHFEDAMTCGEEEQQWPSYLVALAKEKGIELTLPIGIKKRVEEYDNDAELPQPTGKAAEDRFNFKKVFKALEKQYGSGGYMKKNNSLGGESLNITKWTSAERAKHAFDKKDPLPPHVRKALKEGMDIMLA